ncbi:SDR family NAD(P)-dependent oxidoreductase [Halovulum sp. GXIMD14794]
MSGVLQDRVVIVTGAGAGIGLGILRQAVAAGARVTGFDVSDEGRARVEAEGARFARVDVADPEGFAAAIVEVHARDGRLDGLVNNAGVTETAPFLELDLALAERLWRINQRSVLVGCQAAARLMVADGRPGALVNIASNHARATDAGFECYAASKGAITAMTRAMAWSLGPHGIRVNALCPGLTMTEKVRELAGDPALAQAFRNWHATGEVSSVDDIGAAAVYLLGDGSAALTGAEIVADRAMSARLGAGVGL